MMFAIGGNRLYFRGWSKIENGNSGLGATLFMRVLLASLLSLSLIPAAPAQEPELGALANRLVITLQKNNVNTILITSCNGDPGNEAITAQELDEFAAALTTSDSHLHVGRVERASNPNGKDMDCHKVWKVKRNIESAIKAGHFDALAVITVEIEEERVHLSVEVYSNKADKIGKDSAEFPRMPRLSGDESAQAPAIAAEPRAFRNGNKGVIAPKCISGTSASRQEPQINSVASQIADAISQSNVKTVVVFDIAGPDDKMTALGQKLADDFSNELANSSTKLTTEHRSNACEAIAGSRFPPEIIRNPDVAFWLAQSLGAEALISGNISIERGEVGVSVDMLLVVNKSKIGNFKTVLPLTEEMKALDHKGVEEYSLASVPFAGKKGYSVPSCIYCPAARFPAEAIKNKAQGTVLLAIVIGEDGRAHDIEVIKALPYGLTDEAIKAVRSWRFKPTTGPGETPVWVRQVVEVRYQLSPETR
jgi:TonB family protein